MHENTPGKSPNDLKHESYERGYNADQNSLMQVHSLWYYCVWACMSVYCIVLSRVYLVPSTLPQCCFHWKWLRIISTIYIIYWLMIFCLKHFLTSPKENWFDYLIHLLHIILSHHSVRYTPVSIKPNTPEAKLVNRIESMNAEMDSIYY